MSCNCEGKTYNLSFGCCEPVLGPVENYYTKYQIDKMIEEIESGITSGCCITPEEVESAITSAITYVEGEIPSLSGYATEQWVENQGYLTEHQHLKTINGESLVGDGNIVISGGTDLSNYYTTAQTINLVESAVTVVEGEIPTVPTSNTAFTNDAGYITDVACGYDSEAHDPAFVVGYEKDGEYVFGDYSELFRVGEGLKVTAEGALLENHRLSVNTTSAVTSGSTQIPTSDAVYRAISGFATNIELIQYITNLQQQIDSLRAEISGCCGSTGETITRWITMTGASDYTCSGTTKMTKEKEQQSTDGGNTWSDTGNYRSGSTVLEENSADCGYVPPIPTGFKYKLTLDNSSVVSAECDSTSAISRDDVSSYSATCVSVEVGDCVTATTECEESWCGAFSYFKNLTSVTIPNSVVTIGNNSFNYCTSLTSVEIPESVTSLGDYSFGHCTGLTSCTIGSGVTSIGFLAFADTSLEEVTIHDTVTEIGDGCFAQITPLTSVTIGSGVTSIGGAAFSGCTNLTSVTINATVPPTIGVWDSKHDPFENTNNCPIYVPAASVNIYKTATYWSQYASRIQAIQ